MASALPLKGEQVVDVLAAIVKAVRLFCDVPVGRVRLRDTVEQQAGVEAVLNTAPIQTRLWDGEVPKPKVEHSFAGEATVL